MSVGSRGSSEHLRRYTWRLDAWGGELLSEARAVIRQSLVLLGRIANSQCESVSQAASGVLIDSENLLMTMH